MRISHKTKHDNEENAVQIALIQRKATEICTGCQRELSHSVIDGRIVKGREQAQWGNSINICIIYVFQGHDDWIMLIVVRALRFRVRTNDSSHN